MTDVTSSDGTRLALETAGPEGAPTVVLVHGLGLSTESWGDVPARLAGTDRMAGVVFAGSGGSGVTSPGLPTRSLPPALATALHRGWFGVLRTGALVGRRVRGVQALSDALVRRAAFAPGEPAELAARVRDGFLATRPRALAGTTLASLGHDGTHIASHLDVPTLVVHGSTDPEVPEDEARDLLSELPDAEVVTLPGASHVLLLTHGPEVAEQVTRWVARTTQTRTTAPQEAP